MTKGLHNVLGGKIGYLDQWYLKSVSFGFDLFYRIEYFLRVRIAPESFP